jgi:hypothetical protein
MPHINDHRLISDFTYVIQGGLMCRATPAVYGPCMPQRIRFVRWSL